MAKKRKYTTCKKCKKKTNASMKVCQHCGAKLSSNISIITIGFIVFAALVFFELVRNEDSVMTDINKIKQKFGFGSSESVDIPVINNEVLYKGNDVVIISKGMSRYDSGYCLNISVTNDSSMNLFINEKAYAVNGIMVNTNENNKMNCYAAAGKNEMASLMIPDKILNKYNIDKIKYMDLILYASDTNDKQEVFNTGQIEIKTDSFNERTKMFQGKNVYNDNGIRIDFMTNTDKRYYFCVANESGKNISYDIDKITVNDDAKIEGNDHLKKKSIISGCQDVISVKLDDYVKKNGKNSINSIDWKMKLSMLEESSDDIRAVSVRYDLE